MNWFAPPYGLDMACVWKDVGDARSVITRDGDERERVVITRPANFFFLFFSDERRRGCQGVRRMSVVERGCEAHLGPHGVGVRRHLLVAVTVGSLRLRGSLRRGEGRHGQRAREANGGSPRFVLQAGAGRWVLWMTNASRFETIAIGIKDRTRTCMVSGGQRSLRRPVMRPR